MALNSGTVTTLEPAVTIVRGEADGTTTYYKIISTSTPGASSLTVGPVDSEMNSKVQVYPLFLSFCDLRIRRRTLHCFADIGMQ